MGKLSRPNANIVAKKGKLRKVQKRPAAMKSSLWKATKYVREHVLVGSRGQRKDQVKWKRTLPQLLKADDKALIKMLIADKILLDLAGRTCPRCSTGTLSKLCERGPHLLKHRCSKKACSAIITPYHLHPLFSECPGPQKQSLQMQSALLLLRLHRVPQSTIHLLLGTNHKAVENMEARVRALCFLICSIVLFYGRLNIKCSTSPQCLGDKDMPTAPSLCGEGRKENRLREC